VNVRAEQLESQLAKTVASVYVLHGDEPLLALEAADAIRAAARKQGCTEREVFIAERGFDWSELAQAGASQSLFGDRKIIELRIPTGKPGTQGSAAIAEYCERLGKENVTLVSLPRLRKDDQGSRWFGALAAAGVVVDIYPVDRSRLPDWIGARLARQASARRPKCSPSSPNASKAICLPRTRKCKNSACCFPKASSPPYRSAKPSPTLPATTPTIARPALLAGDAARYVRVLDGLRGEGESPVFIVWALGEELRALSRIQQGVAAGRPIEQLLRENRVWGERQGWCAPRQGDSRPRHSCARWRTPRASTARPKASARANPG
jgi:DNA polymerase-3 subunit delta